MEMFLHAIPIAGFVVTGIGFVMLKFVQEVEEYSLAVRSDLSRLSMHVRELEKRSGHGKEE